MFECLLLAGSVWVTPATLPPRGEMQRVEVRVDVGLDTWNRPDVWSIPVYRAGHGDPLRELRHSPLAWSKVAEGRWLRNGNSAEVEREIVASSSAVFPHKGNVFSSTSAWQWSLPENFNGAPARPPRLHTPDSAVPAPGPDGHMAIRQPNGLVFEAYAAIRLSSGDLVALSYSISDPRGLGDGFENGQTASMLPAYFGLVDAEALARGRIGHALAMTVPASMLAPRIRYPAFAFDRGALTERPAYGGALAMGSRLVLDPAVSTRELAVQTREGTTIAEALRTFGAIIVDRGGDGISLRVRRNGATSAVLQRHDPRLQAELRSIFRHLVVAGAETPSPSSSRQPQAACE